MKKIRILNIRFNGKLQRHELPQFRGAVAQKAGREHVLFHNHKGEKLRHRYPLIQYKIHSGRPAVSCIEQGVDEIHHFFSQPDWTVRIGQRTQELSIEKLHVNQITLQVWDKQFRYTLINWLALNPANFKKYNEIKNEQEQKQFLAKLLTGNILSFAKGVDWHIDKQVETKIEQITRRKILRHKGVKLTAFDLDFSSNVFLPDFIGLGKGASHGFGTIKQYKVKK